MKNPIASSRKSAALFGAIALVLTVIGAALRAVNLYTNFEIEAGYYYSSAILVDIMHAFFVTSVAVFAVLAFVMAKKISLEVIESKKDPALKVVLCYLAVAALVYILAKSYFDVYFAMNSPNKILLHMACIAAMFHFVSLARVNLGALKERAYLFFLATTVFICGVYAVPSMFFCAISKIYREYTYFFFDILIFATFAFATVKLIALTVAKKPEAEILPADDIEAIFEGTEVPESTDNDTDTAPEESEEK